MMRCHPPFVYMYVCIYVCIYVYSVKALEREQPLYCHWLVRAIVYCQLLALCGQLDSINECLYYTCYQTICHTLY